MRSSSLYLLTFFITGIANAQGPTITATSEPVAGDIFTYATASVTGVALPDTGANVTWDYSGLLNSGNFVIDTFLTSSSTPYASFYPGTNLAEKYNTNGLFGYFQMTANDWSTLGSILPGSDTGIYQKPLSIFHYPISYGSSYVDSSLYINNRGRKDSSENISYSQAVGYGTLKIPGRTYTNILLVKEITTYRYPIDSSSFFDFYFLTSDVHSIILDMGFNLKNILSHIDYATAGIILPTSYTFNGNGNWSNAANWLEGIVPPLTVPSGTQVTISPQAGNSCILDVQVSFSAGATLTVAQGALFNIMDNLIINK